MPTHGSELQVRAPSGLGYKACWVNVPPLLEREQLVAEMHACIGRAGQDKLLEALQQHHWWPGMYLDVAKCVRMSNTCQREHVGPKQREDLRLDQQGGCAVVGVGNRYSWGLPQGP